MSTVLGVAALALVVGVWLFFERRRVDQKIENTFGGRAALSDDDFYAAFFHNSGMSRVTVAGVREVLADELDMDVSRMIPDDDFSRNLRFLLDNDSMTDVALVEGLEKRFEISISDTEAERTRTVRDLMMLVHEKTLDRQLRFDRSDNQRKGGSPFDPPDSRVRARS